jgi:hypothetical protein
MSADRRAIADPDKAFGPPRRGGTIDFTIVYYAYLNSQERTPTRYGASVSITNSDSAAPPPHVR